MERPEVVLFDLDGTLVEFHHEFLFSETARILDHLEHAPVPREKLFECFRRFDFFSFVPDLVREQFVEGFWRHFDWGSFPAARPFAGVNQLLSMLVQEGVRTAIVTARMVAEEQLRVDLEHTGFLEFLDGVHTRPGEHVHWTDKKETILRACRSLAVDPAKVWMVGDIPPDITCAREVGLGGAVAVESGGISREILEQSLPDAVLPDVTHLIDRLF